VTSGKGYVIGAVNAGPVAIRCDGRNRGEHRDRLLITWWCDDRGWQCPRRRGALHKRVPAVPEQDDAGHHAHV
jgi:predicted GNAT superfamily acetyltransferase